MPKKKLITGLATVAVILIAAGLLVYRTQIREEVIPSEKTEQYSQEFVEAAFLIESKTTDTHDSFSQAFSVLSNQDQSDAERLVGKDNAETVEIQIEEKSEYVRSVEELRDRWTPRFLQVTEDYGKLLNRVDYAREKANLYFENQFYLTSTIRDASLRATFESRDNEEYSTFLSWEAQIERLLTEASDMIDSFTDMDTIIQKQIMSAHFADLSELFIIETPQSLQRLSADIEGFRQQSELLYGVFGHQVSDQFRLAGDDE